MSKYDDEKRKKYTVLDRISEMGRTRVEIECPHCAEVFWAFVWSMTGGGKKCPGCGAMHYASGTAAPEKAKQ